MTSSERPPASVGRVLVSLLRWFAPLAAGLIIGALAVSLFTQLQASAYSWLLTGAGAGVAFALAFFLVLRSLRVLVQARSGLGDDQLSSVFVRTVLHRVLGNTVSEAGLAQATERSVTLAQIWLLGFGSIALLAFAVGVSATLVNLGQVIAAYQQVERLDRQNALLQQQLSASELSESRALYVTQLDPLMRSINEATDRRRQLIDAWSERYKDVSMFSPTSETASAWSSGVNSTNSFDLNLGGSFDGRLALITSLIPPRTQEPQGRPYSPERGRLLSLLLASGVRQLGAGDFSGADLTGMNLELADLYFPRGPFDLMFEELWATSAPVLHLQNAQLKGAKWGHLSFTNADLRGATLPEARELPILLIDEFPPEYANNATSTVATRFYSDLRLRSQYVAMPRFRPAGLTDNAFGADFEGAIIPGPGWLAEVRDRIGGDRIRFSLWKPVQANGAWLLKLDMDSAALLEASFDVTDLNEYSSCQALQASSNDVKTARRMVAAINAQKLDEWRPFSNEKAIVLLTAKPHVAKCLEDLGANFKNAFLGVESDEQKVVLDGLDLSAASFRGANVEGLSLRDARLPKAEAFTDVTLQDDAPGLVLDGAIVPAADWLDTLRRVIRRDEKNDEGEVPSLVGCHHDGVLVEVPLCEQLQRYVVKEVTAERQSEYRIQRVIGR